MNVLGLIDQWPVKNVSAAVIDPAGDVAVHGEARRPYPLASVTKLFTATAAHIAHDEGTIDLTVPIRSLADATGSDVLAHCSGLGPDDPTPITAVGRRRIYSNRGYELIGERIADGAGFGFPDYVTEAVFSPLRMLDSRLDGSPAAGARASLADLVRFVEALRERRLLSGEAMGRLTAPHRPELDGVLPGYGRQQPNPWGQGPELRGEKSPHWTGTANSAETWGHFGQSGTFVWHDPRANVSLIVLTDEPFGEWARARWPVLADAVLDSAT